MECFSIGSITNLLCGECFVWLRVRRVGEAFTIDNPVAFPALLGDSLGVRRRRGEFLSITSSISFRSSP